MRVPFLRILGGAFFILAGLAYYAGVTIGASAAIIFVAAGAAIILLALFGHGGSPGDMAIFVVGLLVLAAFVTPGIATPAPGASQRVTYTVAKSSISEHEIKLLTTTDVGSIKISYSSSSSLGYQVNFTRSSFPFQFFSGLAAYTSLSNETQNGALVVNATARAYDISVTVGTGFLLDVNASTGTGSVSVTGLAGEALGTVSLQSGTGSVSGNLTSLSIGATRLQTGTGSVDLTSNHFSPNGPDIPVALSAGTGSVDMSVKLAAGTSVALDATASLGGVSHELQGFVVSPQSSRSELIATAGSVNTTSSFVIRLSTGTGSVGVDAQFLP